MFKSWCESNSLERICWALNALIVDSPCSVALACENIGLRAEWEIKDLFSSIFVLFIVRLGLWFCAFQVGIIMGGIRH